MIHRDIAGNVEEFFTVNKIVRAVVIKLNKLYKLKVVQAYATTARYDDEAVDSFYDDVKSAVNKRLTQFAIVMRDFNAKLGTEYEKKSAGNFRIVPRNNRGRALGLGGPLYLVERNSRRLMNTFCCKRNSKKSACYSPDGVTKAEIEFILSDNPGFVEEMEVLVKILCSGHRMVWCKVRLAIKRERER